MVKSIDNEFRCLEERSHRGEMVNKSKIVEVKMKLNIVEILLQEEEDEDQKHGWKLGKIIKWLVRKLYEKKLRHGLSAWLKKKEAKLGEAKHRQRS